MNLVLIHIVLLQYSSINCYHRCPKVPIPMRPCISRNCLFLDVPGIIWDDMHLYILSMIVSCCGLATTALCHYENMFSSTFLQERLQESSDSKFSIEVLAVSPALSCRILSQTRLTVSNVIWKHFCLLLRPGT